MAEYNINKILKIVSATVNGEYVQHNCEDETAFRKIVEGQYGKDAQIENLVIASRDKSKDGPWNRNKAKPYKSINPKNQLEMSLGNGRWGDKGRLMIYVKTYGPQSGKPRRIKKKKGCKLISRGTLLENDYKIRNRVLEARASLISLQLIEDFLGKDILTQEMKHTMSIIRNWVEGNMTAQEIEQMRMQDRHRENCTIGRLNKTGVGNIDIAKAKTKAESAVKMIAVHSPKNQVVQTYSIDDVKNRNRSFFVRD